MAPPSLNDRDNKVHTAYGLGMRKDIWMAMRDRFGIENVLEFYGASEGLGTTINYNRGESHPMDRHAV